MPKYEDLDAIRARRDRARSEMTALPGIINMSEAGQHLRNLYMALGSVAATGTINPDTHAYFEALDSGASRHEVVRHLQKQAQRDSGTEKMPSTAAFEQPVRVD